MNKIITAACQAAGVTKEKMLSSTRTRRAVIARQIARWQMCREGGGLQEVAEQTGSESHATVIHSIASLNRMLQTKNPEVMKILAEFMHLYEPSRDGGEIIARAKGKTLVFCNLYKFATYYEGTLTVANMLKNSTIKVVNNRLTLEEVVKYMQYD